MKLGVLFVDDDINIVQGLRRMMYSLKEEWDLFFAESGEMALQILENNSVDVIITDIRMPIIDGNKLLREVKKLYPKIIRITLSGYANDSIALKNSRIVHQSLLKPSNAEIIKATIEKANKLRQKLNSEQLLSVINDIEDLPSLPEIFLRLEEEINSENLSIDRISKIISADPNITAKVLQLTNSAFFGLSNRITNISQALNFLGIKLIQNLVLSIKLFRSIDPASPKAALYSEIWSHSNKVALMAQKIAKIYNLSKDTIDDAYIAGLLHDIGKLIIIEQVQSAAEVKELNFNEFDSKYSNATHADIGAYLLGIWGLPDCIVEAVAYHHSEEALLNEKMNPMKVVYAANKIVNETNITDSELDKSKIEEVINIKA